MQRERLIEKYSKHYTKEMGNFDFQYSEITFEIMKDFNTWKQCAFDDGDEKVIIFYEED